MGGNGARREALNPANHSDIVGEVVEATKDDVANAVEAAVSGQVRWSLTPVAERAAILRRAADLFEANAGEFFALCTREAGKTLTDGIAELREAVDFLRYYASEAQLAEPHTRARGVIACISPWNFPLAIFTGQVAAALVTGNAVIAKPAEQTPLTGQRAVDLLWEAGIPREVLHFLPGDGESVGGPLTADPRIAGVCFTGSTEVARIIERQLAETASADAMLIAETGGLNAMIVDSTALPEQAVRDIVASAFQSAGQRCSALRVLYVQKDIETKLIEMLTGAMASLNVCNPAVISSDVGPVIDEGARAGIAEYCRKMEANGRLIAKLDAPQDGTFIAPHIFRVSGIGEIEREIFGPVLHVATFEADQIDNVIAEINSRGYGLTFGLHTRIDARVQRIIDTVHVGNIYVNRNQIGAIVGSQPFGGEGLSGTGPKAGGPLYLKRFRQGEVDARAMAEGEAVTLQRLRDHMPDPAIGKWSTRQDRISVLRKHLRGKGGDAMAAAAGLDFGPVDLPGPTGEANSLLLAPRGRVLCLGPDPQAVFAQAIQALAAGNGVLAVAPGARTALQVLLGKGMPVEAIDGVVDPQALEKLAVDVVALSADQDALRSVRRVLAKREGPIVRLVAAVINPSAYVLERAVCVDTTAAGGNASLLAAAE